MDPREEHRDRRMRWQVTSRAGSDEKDSRLVE